MKQLSGSAAVQGCPESCGGRGGVSAQQLPLHGAGKYTGSVSEAPGGPGVSASLAGRHTLGSQAASPLPAWPLGPRATTGGSQAACSWGQHRTKQDRGLRAQASRGMGVQAGGSPGLAGGHLRGRAEISLGLSLLQERWPARPPSLNPGVGGWGRSEQEPRLRPQAPRMLGARGQLVGRGHAWDATQAWSSMEVP